MTISPAVDPILIGEAADWLVRLDQGNLHESERLDFERWRNRSPAHAAAWRRAESVMQTIGAVPRELRGNALRGLESTDRRRTINRLAVLLVAAPGAWLLYQELPWRDWSADMRTATGEQKRITLADGTELVLNTASAVNMVFSATERRLHLLAGEIMVTTGKDPSPHYRPFIVETPQGTVRALGTRFTMRLEQAQTQVAVLEDAVEIKPLRLHPDRKIRLEAGQSAVFNVDGLVGGVRALDPSAAFWERGLFLAQNLPLPALLAELSRYRRGVLRCDPQLAQLRVSGAFSVTDTDAALRLLARTLPVRINTFTRYWVSVESV